MAETREDVLTDIDAIIANEERTHEWDADLLLTRAKDEILRLRAKLQAVRERMHGLPIDCYGDANAEGTDVLLARRDRVLAALGGDE